MRKPVHPVHRGQPGISFPILRNRPHDVRSQPIARVKCFKRTRSDSRQAIASVADPNIPLGILEDGAAQFQSCAIEKFEPAKGVIGPDSPQFANAGPDVQGVVKEMHLLVPHSFVYIEVKDAKGGEPQLWALEGTNRMGLEKIGITPDYVKVGDTIKARCHVLKDGSNGCLLGFLKAKDGTVKDWDGGQLAAPAGF